jgi:hypothetical protein
MRNNESLTTVTKTKNLKLGFERLDIGYSNDCSFLTNQTSEIIKSAIQKQYELFNSYPR